MKRYVLLNPGPVNIRESVRRKLLAPDICHREPEFSSLMAGCAKKLLRAFSAASYEAVFITGSGTAALEAAVASSVPRGRKILVINNGIYGERIAVIAGRHGIGTVNIRSDITRTPDLEAVEKKLRADRSIAVVAMVHHETSTGILNPVNEAGKLCRKYKKLYLLDSISAIGGEDLDLRKCGVDICIGTANKCIESIPGVSFVLLKKSALPEIRRVAPRSLYLDIPANLEAQKAGSPLFTPAVQAFLALDGALDELLKEGTGNRIKRYRKLAGRLRKAFDGAGLEYLVDPAYHSNTITALRLPAGCTYEKLHREFKSRGFVIYAGQSRLRKTIFRIANMGQITGRDSRRLIKAVRSIFKK
ncbi:MAG TPA: alanine--glyoxylate aminotransferase family protein [Candidatus Omnitrophota bacterium]|nr:alanine--glyoxylate aminotransferase family protein [Candidatus Omnitrophota bacterium]HOX09437.1 alanine--glyoxylate aminotransferase family protein [Candidatus Omnitrophota bacterium]HPN65813.1 alanine--glyoxylate aminotransferase family protein [Candidatus Omnitrophota bacterium]HRZ66972.1 alanine--glyoxylate aminotransferase family protein [Candidatus Omnitrophota bacterium]